MKKTTIIALSISLFFCTRTKKENNNSQPSQKDDLLTNQEVSIEKLILNVKKDSLYNHSFPAPYYKTHITKFKTDTTLCFIGLEWGAARQDIALIKYNNKGEALWPIQFDSIPLPYIRYVHDVSLKGFSTTLIEIHAREARSPLYYYLYEIKEKKARTLLFIPIANDYIPSNENGKNFNFTKVTYKDVNNDMYDDIIFTGICELVKEDSLDNRLILKKSFAQKVMIYDKEKNKFSEDIKQRKFMFKE